MPVTLVPAITTIWDAQSTTGAVGNKPVVDLDIFKENTASVNFTATLNTVTGYAGTIPNGGDLSGQHVRAFYTTIAFPYMDNKTNGGLRFYMTDGTNTAYWHLHGKDTYSGGWVNSLIYADSTPTTGTVNTAAITGMGFDRVDVASPKNAINTWVDYFRYGDGLVAYGTAWGINDVYLADSTGGVNYGIVGFVDKPYFIFGSLEFGRTSEQTTYADTGAIIVFADANVNTGLYGILFTGNTGVTSTFSMVGCVISTALSAFYLDMDDTNIASLTFTGNTVSGASTSHFLGSLINANITGNVFDGCGAIYPQGSNFTSNTISNTTEATLGSLYLSDATTCTNCTDLIFKSYSGKYAVYIPASVTGTITLDNFVGDASGTDIYWAGTAGTLTVNAINGTNFSTTATAGGTVSIQNAVSLTFSVVDDSTGLPIEGARVQMRYQSNNYKWRHKRVRYLFGFNQLHRRLAIRGMG
jgi:hypothetical protein